MSTVITQMKMIMITKEKFMKYYNVQMEGRYNMLDKRALELTGLSKEDYFEIIKNYNTYYTKFMK